MVSFECSPTIATLKKKKKVMLNTGKFIADDERGAE